MTKITNETDLVNKKASLDEYLKSLLFERSQLNEKLDNMLEHDPKAEATLNKLAKCKKEIRNTRRLLGHYKKMGPKVIKPVKEVMSGRVLKTKKDDLIKRYGSQQKALDALVEMEAALWE